MVQYLSGFQRNASNSISVKDEEWKLLTKDIFENARNADRKLFCRLVPYSNTKFNIYYDTKLPIMDSYFYIGNTEENEVVETQSEPVIQTSPLSMAFDNPQYQFTYFPSSEINEVQATNNIQVTNNIQPVQNQTSTATISTPIAGVSTMGSGGGSSY